MCALCKRKFYKNYKPPENDSSESDVGSENNHTDAEEGTESDTNQMRTPKRARKSESDENTQAPSRGPGQPRKSHKQY